MLQQLINGQQIPEHTHFIFFNRVYCLLGVLPRSSTCFCEQKLVEWVLKIINYPGNNVNKISERLKSITKTPNQVILSVAVDDKINEQPVQKNVIECLLNHIQIIKMSNVQKIKIYVNAQSHICKLIRTGLQEFQHKDAINNIQFIQFDQFYDNLQIDGIQWNKKTVPLVMLMGGCNSVNCLPFNCLIDAQFVFCDKITKCFPSDILKCFQQYAVSKQRHGK